MKITCQVCGHKYDPLKNGGICVKCGMHADRNIVEAAKNEKLEKENDKKVNGNKVTQVLKSYLNERLKQKSKKSPLRSKKVQIPLCCILTVAIGCVVYYGFGIYKKSVEEFKVYKSANDMTVENYNMGDTVNIADNYVRVTECGEAQFSGKYISDGYKVIEIEYQRGEMNNLFKLSDVYLKCGDVYIKPVDRYLLQKLMLKSDEEMKEIVYQDYFTAKSNKTPETGTLFFSVPEDEEEFVLSAYQMSDENDLKKKAEKRLDIAVKESGDDKRNY